MAGQPVTLFANCCYVCKNRHFLVHNHRCRCNLDKKYRSTFGVCKEFEKTDDKEVLSAATLVSTPSDKWYI